MATESDLLREMSALIEASLTGGIFDEPIVANKGAGAFRLDAATVEAKVSDLHRAVSAMDYLFQEAVRQHEGMSVLYPRSLNTLRVLIGKPEGAAATPLSVTVRMGSGGRPVDNAHAGGIFVGIDLESGRLKRYGHQLYFFGGGRFERRANTGVEFDGYPVPLYEDVIDVVTRAHEWLPHPVFRLGHRGHARRPRHRRVQFGSLPFDDGRRSRRSQGGPGVQELPGVAGGAVTDAAGAASCRPGATSWLPPPLALVPPILTRPALPTLRERAKDRVHGLAFVWRSRQFRKDNDYQPPPRTLTVLTYPGRITRHPHILLGKLCAALGYTVTSDPARPFDVAVAYHDQTFVDAGALAAIPDGRPVINARSLDISKERVDREVEAVFGVRTLLDPRLHTGPMVEKSNENAAEGRQLVEGPREPKDGFVYQRLVDSTTSDRHYVEHRVPVHDGRIPLVYRKRIKESDRFTKVAARVDVIEAEEDFSAAELDGIRELCRRMGVEFGELDVLRDRESGVPVVIDVNNTPLGALRYLTDRDRRDAIERLAASFQTMCEVRVGAESVG